MILYAKGGIYIEFYSYQQPIFPLEIFYAKIPNHNPQKIYLQNQLNNIKTGLRGELNVQRYLEEFQFPSDSVIIHNFHSMIHSKWHIQIDYLLISRKGILLIEVKNIAGHIEFHSKPRQIVRTLDNGTVQAMDCPFTQLERNVMGLKQLNLNIPNLSTQTLVVWANRSSRLSINEIPKPHTLIMMKSISLYLTSYFSGPNTLTSDEVSLLKTALLEKTIKQRKPPFCQQYQVNKLDIRKGLYCSLCHNQLKKHIRSWVCPECKVDASEQLSANILSLFDIFDSELKVEVIHEHIPELSVKQIRSILKKLGMRNRGTGRGRIYFRED